LRFISNFRHANLNAAADTFQDFLGCLLMLFSYR
jgi:hypothetical protein